MPVDQFWNVRVVENVDCYWLALLHPENRAGDASVVGDGLNCLASGQVGRDGRNAKREIRLTCSV